MKPLKFKFYNVKFADSYWFCFNWSSADFYRNSVLVISVRSIDIRADIRLHTFDIRVNATPTRELALALEWTIHRKKMEISRETRKLKKAGGLA